jgi:RNA polymerase-binding transcription factor DksA
VNDGIRSATQAEARDPGDEGDESVRLFERDLALNLTGADAARLQEIEEANVRLTRGTYGVCEDCDEPVDPERLELVPEARRCAPCQEAHEEALGMGELRPTL